MRGVGHKECLVDESCVYGCHCRKTVLSIGIKSLFIQFNEHCNDSSDGTLHAPTIYLHIRCTMHTAHSETKDRKPRRSRLKIDRTVMYHRTAVNLLALQFFVVIAGDIRAFCGTYMYDVHKQCNGVCGRINSTN